MSDYTNNYKAGDFTSGKMGEIFKSVFMDSRTTVINHKQFGDCYIIPKEDMKQSTIFVLSSLLAIHVNDDTGLMLLKADSDKPVLEQVKDSPYTGFLEAVIKYNAEGVNDEFDWYTILTKIVDLAYCYDLGDNPSEFEVK